MKTFLIIAGLTLFLLFGLDALGLVIGLMAGLFGIVVGLISGAAGIIAAVFGVVLGLGLALLPILLIIACIWGAVRLLQAI